jgi:hypothetical protein
VGLQLHLYNTNSPQQNCKRTEQELKLQLFDRSRELQEQATLRGDDTGAIRSAFVGRLAGGVGIKEQRLLLKTLLLVLRDKSFQILAG